MLTAFQLVCIILSLACLGYGSMQKCRNNDGDSSCDPNGEGELVNSLLQSSL